MIASSQECALDPQTAGMGASLLARLAEAVPGLHVRPWFAVLPSTLIASLNPWQSQAFGKARRGPELAALLGKVVLSASALRELEKALRAFPEGFVNVRGPGGVVRFFVPAAGVASRLLELWQACARGGGEGDETGLPALIVQEACAADASATSWSFDAASGAPRRVTISVCAGLDVDRESARDRFVVEDGGALAEAQTATKRFAFVPAGESGVEARPLPADLAAGPALDATQLREIASLTRRSAERCGHPLGIAWEISSAGSVLVDAWQETTPGARVGDGDRLRWDRGPVEAFLSGAVSPLGFTVARRWLPSALGQSGRLAWLGGRIALSTSGGAEIPSQATAAVRERIAAVTAPVTDRRASELAQRWLELEALAGEAAAARRMRTREAETALEALVAAGKSGGDRPLALSLVASAGEATGARFLREFQRLGHELQHEEETVRALAQGSAAAQQNALEAGGERGRAVKSWVAAQTGLHPGELGIDAVPAALDPEPVLRALGVFALGFWRAPYHPPSTGCAEIAQRAERTLEERFAGLSQAPKRWTGQRALREARAALEAVDAAEDDERLISTGRRALLAELGRALRAEGAIADPADLRWLTLEEITGHVLGGGIDSSLARLSALRAAEARPDVGDATRFLETSGLALGHVCEPVSRPPDWAAGETRPGLAAGVGQASGPVRIVRDPRRDFVEQGSVLVARGAEPGWAMHLPACAAVVLEYGSAAGGLVRLARHLGIPVVLGVEGVSEALADGSWVRIDGALGTVERIEEAPVQATGDEIAPSPVFRLPPTRFGVPRR